MVKWASIKTGTKVRGYVPSAKILGGKNDLKKMTQLQFFARIVSFFTTNDDFLIKYAYFLKNKSMKVRGYVPSAKILGGKNEL